MIALRVIYALVTTRRTCSKPFVSNTLQTLAKTEYADEPQIRTPATSFLKSIALVSKPPGLRLQKTNCANPSSKEGCRKVVISLSVGCPTKHFRSNRFGNHSRKIAVGTLFMNHLYHRV
ncbi:hypothetical protein AVEN_130147-1 [Araneus ventricosus]|uniref:Uncharacterized protein n=1 Tax=Araneus ventricosus TaxID=182803 RepID=A0A4Y2QC99_ARAVE|nr:hypothetical protein AVEN_130147-1 [Araneus ventricosus]